MPRWNFDDDPAPLQLSRYEQRILAIVVSALLVIITSAILAVVFI